MKGGGYEIDPPADRLTSSWRLSIKLYGENLNPSNDNVNRHTAITLTMSIQIKCDFLHI